MRAPKEEHITIEAYDTTDSLEETKKLFESYEIKIEEMQIKKIDGDIIEIRITTSLPHSFSIESLFEFVHDTSNVRSIKIQAK